LDNTRLGERSWLSHALPDLSDEDLVIDTLAQ